MSGLVDGPLPMSPPGLPTLTSVVVPFCRSRTNTSLTPLVSLATRLLASLSKTTYRPSAEAAGEIEWPLPPPTPVEFTLTRVVVSFVRLRTKTSMNFPLPSLVVRLLASLRNKTKRPSALMNDADESPLPPAGTGLKGLAVETISTDEPALMPVTAPNIRQSQPTTTNRDCELFMDASLLLHRSYFNLIFLHAGFVYWRS